jgi:DNA-binding NtrC family response regulator
LLRVLDGVPYYRLGGSKKVSVNVRVVAATNQNLEELVRAGRFRNDLYHRLAEFKLEIPPLRERPEDLLAIAEQILQQHHPNSHFSHDAVTAMLTHEWPGNVRELRNAIFRAIMLAKNAQVEITSLDLKLNRETVPVQTATLIKWKSRLCSICWTVAAAIRAKQLKRWVSLAARFCASSKHIVRMKVKPRSAHCVRSSNVITASRRTLRFSYSTAKN